MHSYIHASVCEVLILNPRHKDKETFENRIDIPH